MKTNYTLCLYLKAINAISNSYISNTKFEHRIKEISDMKHYYRFISSIAPVFRFSHEFSLRDCLHSYEKTKTVILTPQNFITK